MFEDNIYKGPLGTFLERCKEHRLESIYNTKYKYIKEIIWDTDKQEKYGDDRKGYEKWQQDKDSAIDTFMQYAGIDTLRCLSNYNTKEPLEYIVETKRTSNDSLNAILEIYEDAEDEFYKVLNVTAFDTFNYWFKDQMHSSNFHTDANTIISRIKKLQSIIMDYNTNEEFKLFIDKINN